FTSVTEQWSTVAVAGPRSRDVIAKVAPDLDVSNEAFEFMGFRETTLAGGIPARICRISFSGELAFEINVDAFYGLAVWEAVAAAGAEFDITPYGTETMHVLRAAKGFVIVGQDTDGTVTPQDAGMAWIVSKFKDFLGKRSYSREDTAREDRKHLVGVLPVDGTTRLAEGAQLISSGTPVTPEDGPVPMIGHVSSSYISPSRDRPFGLALVENGRNREGEIFLAPLAGPLGAVELTSPVLYDPVGNRRDDSPHPPHPHRPAARTVAEATALEDLRVSPAAHLAEDMAAASAAGGREVDLCELPFAVQLGLRAQPDTASGKALEDVFGVPLPRRVGQVTGDEAGLHMLWLGPDEFRAADVSRRQQPGETLIAAASLDGLPGQAVDLSANRTILQLSGSKAREVLEKSCRADLHPRAFGVGTAIVTALGPVPVIIHHSSVLE